MASSITVIAALRPASIPALLTAIFSPHHPVASQPLPILLGQERYAPRWHVDNVLARNGRLVHYRFLTRHKNDPGTTWGELDQDPSAALIAQPFPDSVSIWISPLASLKSDGLNGPKI
jgi:hypothetical protein